jgi:hypothetical protein
MEVETNTPLRSPRLCVVVVETVKAYAIDPLVGPRAWLITTSVRATPRFDLRFDIPLRILPLALKCHRPMIYKSPSLRLCHVSSAPLPLGIANSQFS